MYVLGMNQRFIPSNHDGGLAKKCRYTVDEWMQVKLNRKGRRSMWELPHSSKSERIMIEPECRSMSKIEANSTENE